MKYTFIIGLIMILVSIVGISQQSEKLKVEKEGTIVEMTIEQMPEFCLGTKNNYFVYFGYNGKIYKYTMTGDFCRNHTKGELIKMKYLEGSDIVVMPNDSSLLGIISISSIGVLGLLFILFNRKRKKIPLLSRRTVSGV